MIAASMVIHFGYYITLAHAYRTGDLSFAYPLMRGTAPLLVALLGIVFLRELPSAQVAIGIVFICAGIFAIAFAQRHHHPRAAVYWALDQRGDHRRLHAGRRRRRARLRQRAVVCRVAHRSSRACSSSPGYAGSAGPRRWPTSAAQWRRGLLGGFCSIAAYAIVLWAMTRAPVAAVAALRETSVLFAAIIGTVLLKEGFGLARLAGAASVVAGVAALKL